jgi:hypothetical protein
VDHNERFIIRFELGSRFVLGSLDVPYLVGQGAALFALGFILWRWIGKTTPPFWTVFAIVCALYAIGEGWSSQFHLTRRVAELSYYNLEPILGLVICIVVICVMKFRTILSLVFLAFIFSELTPSRCPSLEGDRVWFRISMAIPFTPMWRGGHRRPRRGAVALAVTLVGWWSLVLSFLVVISVVLPDGLQLRRDFDDPFEEHPRQHEHLRSHGAFMALTCRLICRRGRA